MFIECQPSQARSSTGPVVDEEAPKAANGADAEPRQQSRAQSGADDNLAQTLDTVMRSAAIL